LSRTKIDIAPFDTFGAINQVFESGRLQVYCGCTSLGGSENKLVESPLVPMTTGCISMLTGSKTVSILVLIACWSVHSQSQQKPEKPGPGSIQEFPVILEENVIAGKTPAGKKLQAKLAIATWVNGVVVPRNANFSGEVVESSPKAGTEPSRISIRMDRVNWKNGSAPVKVYLTSWYYPSVAEAGQNLQYGPPQPASRTWNGAGAYPDPDSPAYKPFPQADSDKNQSGPDTTSSMTSKHRVVMKNVETQRNGDGGISLVSKHANIKLDRFTMYVLAAGDPAPAR